MKLDKVTVTGAIETRDTVTADNVVKFEVGKTYRRVYDYVVTKRTEKTITLTWDNGLSVKTAQFKIKADEKSEYVTPILGTILYATNIVAVADDVVSVEANVDDYAVSVEAQEAAIEGEIANATAQVDNGTDAGDMLSYIVKMQNRLNNLVAGKKITVITQEDEYYDEDYRYTFRKNYEFVVGGIDEGVLTVELYRGEAAHRDELGFTPLAEYKTIEAFNKAVDIMEMAVMRGDTEFQFPADGENVTPVKKHLIHVYEGEKSLDRYYLDGKKISAKTARVMLKRSDVEFVDLAEAYQKINWIIRLHKNNNEFALKNFARQKVSRTFETAKKVIGQAQEKIVAAERQAIADGTAPVDKMLAVVRKDISKFTRNIHWLHNDIERYQSEIIRLLAEISRYEDGILNIGVELTDYAEKLADAKAKEAMYSARLIAESIGDETDGSEDDVDVYDASPADDDDVDFDPAILDTLDTTPMIDDEVDEVYPDDDELVDEVDTNLVTKIFAESLLDFVKEVELVPVAIPLTFNLQQFNDATEINIAECPATIDTALANTELPPVDDVTKIHELAANLNTAVKADADSKYQLVKELQYCFNAYTRGIEKFVKPIQQKNIKREYRIFNAQKFSSTTAYKLYVVVDYADSSYYEVHMDYSDTAGVIAVYYDINGLLAAIDGYRNCNDSTYQFPDDKSIAYDGLTQVMIDKRKLVREKINNLELEIAKLQAELQKQAIELNELDTKNMARSTELVKWATEITKLDGTPDAITLVSADGKRKFKTYDLMDCYLDTSLDDGKLTLTALNGGITLAKYNSVVDFKADMYRLAEAVRRGDTHFYFNAMPPKFDSAVVA